MGYVDWKGLLDQNVEVMGSAFKTDGNDMRMLGAFLCAAHGCVADKKKMDECKGILKDKFGVLSEFRGNLQVPLIIKMSMSENPEGYLQRISDIYEGLSAGYKLGNDLRLLAAVILCDNTTLENQKEVYVKTTEIYEKMKEQHSVMSGQNDIPFAALMAIQNEDAGIILGRAEDCYKLLGGRFKLSKGDILNVSRILSLSDSSIDELCDSFLKMFDALKDGDVAIKGTQMAILGVLVNLGVDTDTAVSLIKSNEEMLRGNYAF